MIDERTLMVFDKSRDGKARLTQNFRVSEFACKDGTRPIFVHPYIPVICQIHRNVFGYSFTPNSTYRTIPHNKVSGGASNSNHIYGLAVDIPAGGKVKPKEMYEFWDRVLGNWGELGLYSWGIHIGIQRERKRFNGNT